MKPTISDGKRADSTGGEIPGKRREGNLEAPVAGGRATRWAPLATKLASFALVGETPTT